MNRIGSNRLWWYMRKQLFCHYTFQLSQLWHGRDFLVDKKSIPTAMFFLWRRLDVVMFTVQFAQRSCQRKILRHHEPREIELRTGAKRSQTWLVITMARSWQWFRELICFSNFSRSLGRITNYKRWTEQHRAGLNFAVYIIEKCPLGI